MLSIFWGVTKDCYYYIDREFMEELELEWFKDPVVLEIIHDIDNCIFDFSMCIDCTDPSIIFPISGLSTGSKGLIMLLKMEYDSICIWGTAFGDNCSKWILKIAEKRDITLELEHFMKFPEEEFKAYSCHSKRMFCNYEDYKYEVLEYGFYSWAYEDFEPEEA